MEILTLDMIKLDCKVYIDDITNHKLKNRMIDLGLVKNAEITPVFNSPAADPIAYKTKNLIIALRKNEAKYVKVIPYLSGDKNESEQV